MSVIDEILDRLDEERAKLDETTEALARLKEEHDTLAQLTWGLQERFTERSMNVDARLDAITERVETSERRHENLTIRLDNLEAQVATLSAALSSRGLRDFVRGQIIPELHIAQQRGKM